MVYVVWIIALHSVGRKETKTAEEKPMDRVAIKTIGLELVGRAYDELQNSCGQSHRNTFPWDLLLKPFFDATTKSQFLLQLPVTLLTII